MADQVIAREIDGDDAAWLRGQDLPEDVELHEVDEVLFMGRIYEEQPSTGLLLPQTEDPVHRLRRQYIERKAEITGLDIFSGCGGFSLGMHAAGIDVVAAAEWDYDAAWTYLHNLGRPDCRVGFGSGKDRDGWFKKVPDDLWMGTGYRASRRMESGCQGFYFGDIRKTSGREILALAGVERVNVIFGGPPCQGLSRSNAKSCIEDPRNANLWEFMRIVEELKPNAFIIENVPPLITIANGALIEALGARAANVGYTVVADILDAVGYGVPQYRRRALIVGTLGDMNFQFPIPQHWCMGWTPEGKRWRGRKYRESRDKEPVAAEFDHETQTWRAPTDKESNEEPPQTRLEIDA